MGQQKRSQVMLGSQNEFSLRVTEIDIHDLHATIRSPSGFEEPCVLKKLANGSLGISFIPRETGDHLVNVYRDGQHIKNSPFRIHVGSAEIGDASKVRVYGRGLQEGKQPISPLVALRQPIECSPLSAYAYQSNEFTVVTRDAGMWQRAMLDGSSMPFLIRLWRSFTLNRGALQSRHWMSWQWRWIMSRHIPTYRIRHLLDQCEVRRETRPRFVYIPIEMVLPYENREKSSVQRIFFCRPQCLPSVIVFTWRSVDRRD